MKRHCPKCDREVEHDHYLKSSRSKGVERVAAAIFTCGFSELLSPIEPDEYAYKCQRCRNEVFI